MEAALPHAWAPDPDEPVTIEDIIAQSNRTSDVEALDNVLSNRLSNRLSKLDSKTKNLLAALTAAARNAVLLGVYTTAALLLIAVFCTTVVWLAVLWLHAHLLLLGANLVRSALDKQCQPLVVVHAPEETDAEASAADLTPEPATREPESQSPPFEEGPLPEGSTSYGALAEDGPVIGSAQIPEAPQPKASSLRTNPFGGNLAEAKEFLTDATKAQWKKKWQANPRQQQRPLRVGPPAKFSKPAAFPKLQPPAIAAPIPPLPAGFIPPHMRKTLEAQAKAEAETKKQAEHVAAFLSSPQPQGLGKENVSPVVKAGNIGPSVQTIILTPCPRGGKVEVVGASNNSRDRPLDRILYGDAATVFDEAHAKQTKFGGGASEQHTANGKATQTDRDGQSRPSAAESPLIDIEFSSAEAKPIQSKPPYTFADQFGITGSRVLFPAKAPSTKPGLASTASISQWNKEWPPIELPPVAKRHSHATATKLTVVPSHELVTQRAKPSTANAVPTGVNEMLGHMQYTLDNTKAALPKSEQGPHAAQRAKRSSVFGGKAVAAPPGLAKAPVERQWQFDSILRSTTTLDTILKSNFDEAEPRKSLVSPVQPPGTSLCDDTENAIDDSNSVDGESDGSDDGDSKDVTDDSEAEEEDDGEEEEENATALTKRAIALQKKEVRSLVKDAWINREMVRRSVCNKWQAEDYANLARSTKVYLERRDELAGLMASGQLNDEDAQVYPILHEASTAPPKRKPSHCEQLITALKKSDKAAVAGVRAPPRQLRKLEEAQRKMASVHRAREGALAAADSARLKRCNVKYMAERRALIKVLEEEDEGLLDDVYEKYLLI